MYMKLKILIFTFCLVSMDAMAQSTITGQVVDKVGLPISGAKVNAIGQPLSATTAIDGHFQLEAPAPVIKATISAAGKATATQLLGQNTIVMLKDNTWWTETPSRTRFFVNANTTFEWSLSGIDQPFGVMAGFVKTYGGYVRFVVAGLHSTTNGSMGHYYNTRDYLALSAGPVIRLGCPLHLYTGLGYVKKTLLYESNGKYYKVDEKTDGDVYDSTSYSGLTIDLGLMMNYKHLNFNLGTTAYKYNFAVQVGVGVMF